MKKVKILATLNLLIYVIAFAVSNLSQLGIFGGGTNKDISDKYDTVFTPAGLTFAIWGVIYLSLFGFAIYHLVRAYKDDIHADANQDILKIGNLFIINNIATTFWVFAFTYEYLFTSMLLIIIQLITLIKIFINLNLFDNDKTFTNKLLTQFPLTIYFAWLCVANIANISVYLVSKNWDGFGIDPSTWAMLMIVITVLLSIFIITVKKNPFFGLVVVWALYGIVLKRTAVDETVFANVILTAWIGFGIVAVLTVFQWYKIATYKKHQLNA
ncbi:hypothetical protein [Pedobacter arcticus]|uniref:hypothetical protein n=1 Tax=Pedobacter arcticus TaxID=752140 RepID=UPI0003123FD4|nr:hypothetical protein [Pedobacter arcticus]